MSKKFKRFKRDEIFISSKKLTRLMRLDVLNKYFSCDPAIAVEDKTVEHISLIEYRKSVFNELYKNGIDFMNSLNELKKQKSYENHRRHQD